MMKGGRRDRFRTRARVTQVQELEELRLVERQNWRSDLRKPHLASPYRVRADGRPWTR